MMDKWHYFVLGGFEYLVLGYSRKANNCLVVCSSDLSSNDQRDLEYIAGSEAAQKEAYLVNILVKQPHASGGTWWEHLYPRVFFAYLDQLRDRIPQEQFDVFRASRPHSFVASSVEIIAPEIKTEVSEPESFILNCAAAVRSEWDTKNGTIEDIIYSQIG